MPQNRITVTFNNDEEELYNRIMEIPNKSEFFKNLARQFFDGGCEGSSANVAGGEAAVDPELEKIEIEKLYTMYFGYLDDYDGLSDYIVTAGGDRAVYGLKYAADALFNKYGAGKYAAVMTILAEKKPQFRELIK